MSGPPPPVSQLMNTRGHLHSLTGGCAYRPGPPPTLFLPHPHVRLWLLFPQLQDVWFQEKYRVVILESHGNLQGGKERQPPDVSVRRRQQSQGLRAARGPCKPEAITV